MARIYGEIYGEFMEGSSQKDYIFGDAGDDTILGYGGNDTLDGGDDNDSIIGGKGNDSLAGGDGADVFVYASGDDGNDTIVDYAKEDKIQFTSGTVDDIYNDGDDVIFKIGSNKITVKNATAIPITYIDADGVEHIFSNETVKYNTKGTAATLLAGYSDDTFNVADTKYSGTLKTINGSAADHDIAITANKLANVIIGGAGNNTIHGAKGNDTLTGGDGADTFVFSSTDGKDVITDYSEEDVIQFTSGTIKSVKKSGDDVVFTFSSSNKVTVKDGASKVITYVENGVEKTFPEDVLTLNKSHTSVSLLSAYVSEQFDVNTNAQVSDYAGTLKTINASAVDHDIEITGTSKANRIIGGSEDDTIFGGKGNDTLTGGEGEDVFVFNATDGKNVITDYEEKDTIKIASGEIANVSVKGSDVVFTFNKSNTITVKNAADKIVTYIDADGVENIYPEPVKWNAKGTTATLLENYSASTFVFSEQGDYAKTIKNVNASAVDYSLFIYANGSANSIIGTEEDDYIAGRAGKDTILGGDGNDTLVGGTGNDILTGGDGDDVFVYNSGDGNDKITDYEEGDTIQINSGTVKKIAKSGKNVIITVGSSKISVMGAAEKYITYIDKDGVTNYWPSQPTPPVVIDGKTITLTERYNNDTFDVADYDSSITTINASAVTHDISITGNRNANRITGTDEDDYIDGGKGKDTILGGDGNDTLVGGTGNDSLTGGDGADVFVYNKGDGDDRITDYTEEDIIQFTSGTVTAKTSGNNVIFTVKESGKTGHVSVIGGKEHVINYVVGSDFDNMKLYPAKPLTLNDAGTGATLLSNYRATTFDATTNAYVADYADILKTIDGSQVTHDIEIIGNKNANRIIGGENNDTLIGGKGNDTLLGGEGQDVFVYNGGDGKDVITDYTAGEDVIQIASGNISTIKNSGNDVVFNVGTGSITLKDAKDKSITYIDPDGVERTWPTPWVLGTDSEGRSVVTLTDRFSADSFDVTQIDELRNVRTIDAGAISKDFAITGNAQNNVIIGSKGKNTIDGAAGNDTLTGGAGADIFVYNEGDGNDLVLDYGTSDVVSIASGELSGDVRVKDGAVIFTVGDGKISLDGAAGKRVTVWYDGEKTSKIYTSSAYGSDDAFFYSDDADFGSGNDLSAIVQGKATDYAVAQSDYSLSSLTPKSDSVPVLATSDKK